MWATHRSPSGACKLGCAMEGRRWLLTARSRSTHRTLTYVALLDFVRLFGLSHLDLQPGRCCLSRHLMPCHLQAVMSTPTPSWGASESTGSSRSSARSHGWSGEQRRASWFHSSVLSLWFIPGRHSCALHSVQRCVQLPSWPNALFIGPAIGSIPQVCHQS